MLEIAKKDILARLSFDNPWWEEGIGTSIPFEETPRRKYFETFLNAISERSVQRAVVLMGPRRVGKTVMVYQAIKALMDSGIPSVNILYLSLETPIYTGLSLENILNYFLEMHSHPKRVEVYLFFDEVQYLKNWEVHLKSLVDSYPACKFVVTGSAAAALRLKSTESGAGRFSDFILPPLTFAEYLKFIGRENELIEKTDNINSINGYISNNIELLNFEFINYLNYGGYPEAVFSPAIRQNPGQYIKSDIIDKVLLRDLPSLYGIDDIQELNRLFTVLAYNSSGEVSLEKLASSSGVAKNTIKRYLEYLEAAFLIRRIERIDQNSKRFKRAMTFKVYLTNPSMRAALFGQINENSEVIGPMTETAIFSQWTHFNTFNLYYARWNSGEVDIVSLAPLTQKAAWAAEVKWSDRPYTHKHELDNCVEFCVNNSSIKSTIIITSRTILDCNFKYKGINFEFYPASLYAYVLGTNLLQRLIPAPGV